MDSPTNVFGKYRDENGEEYYCQLQSANGRQVDSEWATDHCVEASTTGRYAGNLNVSEGF